MQVIRELVGRVLFRGAQQRSMNVAYADAGMELLDHAPSRFSIADLLGVYDTGTESTALFAALHRDDLKGARFRADRLRRAARRQNMRDVAIAAEVVELSLICCESCGAIPVFNASTELVRALSDDGVLVTAMP